MEVTQTRLNKNYPTIVNRYRKCEPCNKIFKTEEYILDIQQFLTPGELTSKERAQRWKNKFA